MGLDKVIRKSRLQHDNKIKEILDGVKIEYDTDEKPGYWVDANSVEIDQYTSIFLSQTDNTYGVWITEDSIILDKEFYRNKRIKEILDV